MDLITYSNILRINLLEEKIYSKQKLFNEAYEKGMSLSSDEAVNLSRQLEHERNKLKELQRHTKV